MEKKEKAPVLRFKDTNGKDYPAWEQHKLGDLGHTYGGLSGKSKQDFGHGDARFVTYMNVFSNPIGDPCMVDSIEIDDRQSRVRKGDVLFTTSSETPDEVGMSCVWPSDSENLYLNSFCFGYRPTTKINSNFLASLLRSPSVREKIIFLAQGISRYNISKNKVMEISIPLPSEEEQSQIGDFFTQLDKTITLHQRKLEALKKLKRTLLQKMFPKKGHLKPELRFFGFTNDWEQRKLGDIGTVQMNKRIFKTQTSTSGEIPFYKIGTFGKIPDAYISRELFEEYKKKYPYPKKGDLLLSASGSIGNVVEYNGEEAYFQDSNIVWLEHGKTISNFFLKAFYSVVNWEGIEGTTIKRLYNKTILDTPITLPSFEEQEKIGNFFTVLDKVITLHQRKLEIYKKLKKGLLQKMFI